MPSPTSLPAAAEAAREATLAKATAFAAALGKLKAKEEQNQGCALTADEVAGMIWAIRQLRGASR